MALRETVSICVPGLLVLGEIGTLKTDSQPTYLGTPVKWSVFESSGHHEQEEANPVRK